MTTFLSEDDDNSDEKSIKRAKKIAARQFANRELQKGELLKLPCRDCGGESDHMHHHDYDKPLDVIWFCIPCHMIEHAKIRKRKKISAMAAAGFIQFTLFNEEI